MDVRAILLIGSNTPPDTPADGAGSLAGVPLPLCDVLGRPVVAHVIDQLRQAGVDAIAAVSDDDPKLAPYVRRAAQPGVPWLQAAGANRWRACEYLFNQHIQAGTDLVLLFRLGSYAELDLDELVQFHLDSNNRVTAVEDAGGRLDIFVISASRRNDAAFLLRHELRQFRTPCKVYLTRGYVNRLERARDLRRLAQDALLQRIAIRPAGREVKPGVWVAEGARVHPRARLLAPAFIGEHARVRAAAVITRGSVLEHHCEVDCGTVVDNATLLPHSYVGPGLDVAHSVVGFQRVISLVRGVEVEIHDSKLVSATSPHAPLRAMAGAAALAGYLPTQFLRGLFSRTPRQPATLPAAAQVPGPSLAQAVEKQAPRGGDPEAAKFPANLVVARRYGNE